MGALADVPVRMVSTERHPGARNMALDAVAAERAATDGIATVRVYGWDPSTLSLGYAQDPATIDWDVCADAGIEVTRRPTGGGAIYHDRRGDVSYSIVAPSDVLPEALTPSYRLLCEPIVDALGTLGVDASFADEERPACHEPACYLRALHPSHDLVVADGDRPRKISGNAQYRRRSAVVQHGSLTVHLSPDTHARCFADDVSPDAFRDRVTEVVAHADVGRSDVIDVLRTSLEDWAGASSGSWSSTERERAAELVETKFGADSWVRERVDPEVSA